MESFIAVSMDSMVTAMEKHGQSFVSTVEDVGGPMGLRTTLYTRNGRYEVAQIDRLGCRVSSGLYWTCIHPLAV